MAGRKRQPERSSTINPNETELNMANQILIDSLDTATLRCPNCNRKKIMQLSQYNIRKPKNRIKCCCSCGHTFRAALEQRGHNIKDMKLWGTYTSKELGKWCDPMTIKRLNARGVTLLLKVNQKIPPGYKLQLEFVLDDGKQSMVKKEVVVTATDGPYLSAEFASREHFDNLGPYLFVNKLLG